MRIFDATSPSGSALTKNRWSWVPVFLKHLGYAPHYGPLVLPIVAVAFMAHDPRELTLAKFAAMCAVASIMAWSRLRLMKRSDRYFDALAELDALDAELGRRDSK